MRRLVSASIGVTVLVILIGAIWYQSQFNQENVPCPRTADAGSGNVSIAGSPELSGPSLPISTLEDTLRRFAREDPRGFNTIAERISGLPRELSVEERWARIEEWLRELGKLQQSPSGEAGGC